jgi:hypothetical protein
MLLENGADAFKSNLHDEIPSQFALQNVNILKILKFFEKK